ncbi:hypothetical protein DRJ24_04295 [Candidatus Acetothermia bacterium]|nr:MAG: hypothetical protein DRJ24_04295 [Candidatus Acetothermia bacterium]
MRWADLSPVRGCEQGGRRPVVVISHAYLLPPPSMGFER